MSYSKQILEMKYILGILLSQVRNSLVIKWLSLETI